MNNIKKFRSKKGLSQESLGSYLGIGRAGMCYLENKNNLISKKNAKILCEVLNCSEIELNGMNNFAIYPKTEEDNKYLIKLLCTNLQDSELSNKILKLLGE